MARITDYSLKRHVWQSTNYRGNTFSKTVVVDFSEHKPSSNDCNHWCRDPWLQNLLCGVRLTFKLESSKSKNFQSERKKKRNSFDMKSISRVYRIIRPICNQCLITCTQNFDVSMSTGFQIWLLSIM